MTRTKYRFKDRAEAEAAFVEADSKHTEYVRALNASLRGEVEYLPMIGPFKLGLFWLERGNGHILLLQPKSNGASVIAMDCDEFLKWADGEAGHFEPMLRRCSFHARRIRAAVWKGAEMKAAVKDEKDYMKENYKKVRIA